jgi:hypothetical protein
MRTLLNYIDENIERERLRTGNYPDKLILSKEEITKMKELLSEIDKDIDSHSWIDDFPKTYRGITIEIKE